MTARTGWITGMGLKPLQRLEAELVPGKCYYMGASSRPDLIMVTALTETMIFYVERYAAAQKEAPRILRIERRIGEDLIRRGQETTLKHLAAVRQRGEPWITEQYIARTTELATTGAEIPHAAGHYICNCCGDESIFDEGETMETAICPSCAAYYKAMPTTSAPVPVWRPAEPHDPMRLVGRMV